MNIPRWKPLAIGVVGTLATLYVISRLLPGAAQRVGLQPRPLTLGQWTDWYEPFGGRKLSGLWNKAETVSAKSSEGGGGWNEIYGD